MEEFAQIMIFYAVYMLVFSLISLVMYVLQSLGMYPIAKRRGINNPWLAWIPLGSMWILGSIADDYQLKANNAIKSRRKTLLILPIVLLVLVFVMYAPLVGMMVESVIDGNAPDMEDLVGSLAATGLIALVVMVITIVLTVFQYICMYELFASCDPSNKTVYLVLSIVVSGVAPILMFICRNKDDGLYPAPKPAPYGYIPPQYQQPTYQQPAYQQPTYQQPTYQQPTYQQPTYQQPTYQQPTYQQPTYQQPTYQQPQEPVQQDSDAQQ